MRRFVAAFARNTVFANILLLGVILAGVISAKLMIREMFPEFSVEVITVNVPFPGADPEEVEEGICRKIEEAVDGVEGIKQYTTQAHENRGSAFIEIEEGYDVAKAKDEIKGRIDAISTFPVDAEEPIISEIILKHEVLILALSGPLDERRLKEWAGEIKIELRNLPGVSQIQIAGANDYEIAIEVSEERLQAYGLAFRQVADAVRSSSLNMAGGTVRTKGEQVRLRTLGRKYWGDEFGKIVVLSRPQGEIITLDRVATVKDGFVEDRITSTLNGEPALLVIVSKTSQEDAIAISKRVHQYVARKQAMLPEGLKITVWSDLSEMIEARIRLLVRNGAIGLCLVVVLLWLFLDVRLSFWAAMGIPISVLGALAILYGLGHTLNMISLFGLIMVVGIVVDDAIVVGEAIYVHRKRGSPPLRAAVEGVMEIGVPVIAAVTTTIVAFLPIMFVGGVMGKFIRIMPIAVICCLAISLVECLVMLPAHLSHLPDPDDPKRRERERRNPLSRLRRRVSDGLESFVEHAYLPFIRWVLRWRYAAVCVAIAVMMCASGLKQGGFLKFVMFPSVDGNTLTANVEFPNGTPEEVTREAVERIEQALHRVAAQTPTRTGEPLLENVFAMVGGAMVDDPGGGGGPGPHLGAVRVEMLDSEYRGVHSRELMSRWERVIGEIPGALSLTVSGLEGGPPGKPIEVWLQGDAMDEILAAADELVTRLKEFEGVSQVQHDFRPGKNEVRFELKPEARTLGLTVGDLARQVHAGYFGEEALRLQRGREDIRVRVRYPLDERSKLSDLNKVRIRTPQGFLVPLRSVANVSYGPGYAGITRTNGLRRVEVSAEVDTSKANAEQIVKDLRKDYLDDFLTRHRGILLSFQGAKKDTAESMKSLFIGFPLALIGIFVIIATIFRSYAQPFVIMLTVPFGIIGAVFGHLVMGFDITIISMFGIVALSGVVVNDAIVLIECINRFLAGGMPVYEALRRGGARRFRAIFLTTISTCGALTPMILEKDFQAQLLIPMAISLAFGVAFATLLTLLLIPCLLGILNDLRRLSRRIRRGYWPTPEEVEPAARRDEDLRQLEPSGTPLEPVTEVGGE